ncbi:MAG: alpha/beta fold hydrolase [Myxococcota bacterium]
MDVSPPADEIQTDRFRTLGGDQAYRWCAPKDARACFAVLPAVGIRGAYYDAFLQALAARGFAGAAADWPGSGESPVRADRRTRWSYDALVNAHAAGLRNAVEARFAGVPFYWVGHSLGGHVALMHAGRYGADGVCLLASGGPDRRAWRGASTLGLAGRVHLMVAITGALGYWPGRAFGFGERESAQWVFDWYRAYRTGSFRTPRFDGDAALRAWTGPTLVVTVADDPLAPKASTQFLVGRTRSEVQWQRWSPDHPVGHNRWPRLGPDVMAERIEAWVRRSTSAE